jgi:membrane protease YdiL (CAAX protease family)
MSIRVEGRARTAVEAAAIALACAALMVRTLSYASMGATALVGAVGLVARVRAPARATAARWIAVTAAGGAAFWLARMGGNTIGIRLTGLGVFSIVLAAVAEEAFFRRAVYGFLHRWGAGAAVAGAAILFAVIHVPFYGWGALPIDLAAGLLLGWQRYATGTWTSPALTHVLANLMQMG